MKNLHDPHVRFRSAGGSNAPENRVTLCATTCAASMRDACAAQGGRPTG